ncbi:MAG TPA: hypothetical protein VKR32_00565 [Puia sp.]|nr:hypothetical protein [Puia sp.]
MILWCYVGAKKYSQFKLFPWGGDSYFSGGNNADFQSGFFLDLQKKIACVFFTPFDESLEFNNRLSKLMINGEE